MTAQYWLDNYGKVHGPDGVVNHAELYLAEGYAFEAPSSALTLLCNAGGHTKTFHGWLGDTSDGTAQFRGLVAAFKIAVTGFDVRVLTPAGERYKARVLANNGLHILCPGNLWDDISADDFRNTDTAKEWERRCQVTP